jgi:glutamate--cysteine ligase
MLDRAHENALYSESLAQQRSKVADATLTPSAQVLSALRERRMSYAQYARQQSEQHALHFRSRPLSPPQLVEFIQLAERSLHDQIAIETNDQLPFDEYLQRYFQQYRNL